MDYNQARMEFEQYLNDYDRTDGKVKLKITHTYGVVARSGQIAERMGLSAEDRELAKMIALLHDIRKIEQLKRYDSFCRKQWIMRHMERIFFLKEGLSGAFWRRIPGILL